jgi:hypothetical protein
LAAGLAAAFGAGFFAGAALVFDFAAVFVAITVLFAAPVDDGSSEQGPRGLRSLKRIAAGSVDRAH